MTDDTDKPMHKLTATDPKPLQPTAIFREAIDMMVHIGTHRDDAAKAVGMLPKSLYKALAKPHVKRYFNAQLEVLRNPRSRRALLIRACDRPSQSPEPIFILFAEISGHAKLLNRNSADASIVFAPHCIEAAKSDLLGTKILERSMFTAQIVARLKSDEEQYVRRRAEQEDRSISSVIRCLVNEAMKSEQQHQAAA
jgi:hypothetical protein